MLGATIGIGVLASLSAVGIFGKASSNKYLAFLLFTSAVVVYLGVILKQLEFECKVIELILGLCILPCMYMAMINWSYMASMLIGQLSIIGFFLALAKYLEILDAELVLNTINGMDLVVQVVSQVACGVLVAIGYTYIPELLLAPAVDHILKKANFEYIQYAITRAKSNISFKYTCRGLPTPKFEKKNLKTIEREHDEIQDLIAKLEKSPFRYKVVQILSIISGCLILCLGFWTLALLSSILIENLVVSSCGFHCGFTSDSRISSLISSQETIFTLLSGSFYLTCSLFGFLRLFTDLSKEFTSESILGLTFSSVSSSFAIKTLLAFIYPSSFSILFRPLQFILNVCLVACTFLYFIYWHCFKCKKR